MVDRTDAQASVLIPTGFAPGGYSCVRSLARRGVRTVVASEHRDVPAGASRFCDERLRIPAPRDDLLAYRDALKRIAARPGIETIVPMRPQDTYLFAKYREAFDRHVSLVVPPFETLATVHDRIALFEAASEAGVPVPETGRLDEFADGRTEYIVKSRYNLLASEYVPSYSPTESGFADGIRHVEPGSEPDIAALTAEMEHVPIGQERIRSETQYVFGALYDRGEPVTTFQHRQIRGNSYASGGGVYRESMYDPELESVGRRLLDYLEWHGLACAEYAKDSETGEYKLLEINPRMWQSLPCAVRAGADFPYDYWCLATGRPESIDPRYDVGVKSHFLYGELNHLLSVLRDESSMAARPEFTTRTWEILKSFCLAPHFDEFRLDDPVPFACGLCHLLRTRLR
ncbi:carboxylate--amine ligase [Natrinema sp. LN54]|uniref:carboxylate--amine ligase n=1 Tax=Natrinema sp. LN54 TaxID=3458705 RepID=UPI0040375828